jgi:hypothetical protein
MVHRRLSRDLGLLKAWAAVSTLLVVGLAAAAFRQVSAPARSWGEISVERINVVDADGTLRLVIANKKRMHPGVMDGKMIDRPRPVAGLIFFNDEGDEVGGLTYAGQEKDGERRADAGIMFDQLKQDQTIGFSYTEKNGERRAGFEVWDRSDRRLSDLIDKLNASRKIAEPAAREAAVAAVRASAPKGPRRVFVGKEADRTASVSLADAEGRPRLRMSVDGGGAAAIEFLDAAGRVTSRLPR